MSDYPQQQAPPPPGWWQASDGNWYPPQSAALPPPPQQQMYVHQIPVTNGMATVGLTLGIIGLCLFFIPFVGLVLGGLGVIFGLLGVSKAKSLPAKLGNGKAIAGIATGAIAVAIGILWIMAINQASTENCVGRALDNIESNDCP